MDGGTTRLEYDDEYDDDLEASSTTLSWISSEDDEDTMTMSGLLLPRHCERNVDAAGDGTNDDATGIVVVVEAMTTMTTTRERRSGDDAGARIAISSIVTDRR